MKTKILFFFLCFISYNILFSQHQNVVVAPSQGWGLPTEPALVLNPVNNNEILVGGMLNNDYYSADGGFSWTHELLQSPFGVNADPVILIDNNGRYYYLHLPDTINRVICHRKDNLSAGWDMESIAAFDGIHDVDKEWASYDPLNDRINLTWTYFDDWGSSSPTDSSCIYYSHSDNGGQTWYIPVRVSDRKGNAAGGMTWSSPVRVNDDPPDHQQFFPFITVDQVTGKVWLLFFDRRNYSDSNTDVYMAVSDNGGDIFTNFKVSETPFIPFATVFFGHYLGVTAVTDHIFAVWNRMDNGENSLTGAIIDPTIIGNEEISEVVEARLQNYPNPFTENSFISFRLKEPETISLQLFGITGRLISTLINQQTYSKGKHITRIDAAALGLKPGAYMVRLSSGKEQICTRVLFVGK